MKNSQNNGMMTADERKVRQVLMHLLSEYDILLSLYIFFLLQFGWHSTCLAHPYWEVSLMIKFK